MSETKQTSSSNGAEKVTAIAIIMFAVITIGGAMGNFSQTAMNSMLVDVRNDFGVDVDTSQLLTTVYMLVIGVTVPIVAYFSRRFSLRTVLLTAWVIFALGGLVDLLTGNFWVFLVGRILQAIATGIAMPVGMTFAMLNFPANRQGTAMGVAGIAMGFAPNVGPLIGGAFSETVGWRFFFILILIVAALLFAATCVFCKKEPNNPNAGSIELVSVLFSTLGFGGILLGCSNASSHGLTSPMIWAPLVIGIVCVVLFVLRQKRIEQPLINLDIFKSRHFKVGFILQNALTGSFMGVLLILPLFVTTTWGGTAVDSGLVLIPTAVVAGLFNPVSGILNDKIGTRKVVVVAGVFLVIGATSMTFIDQTTPLWLIAALQAVRAMGISSIISPFFQWSLKGLPRELVMDGSTFSNTVRQCFASICSAIMVFFVVFFGAMDGVDPALGYHFAFGLSAVLAIITYVLAVAKLRD